MQAGRDGRFEELDVLRGLAAVCVTLSHYSGHSIRYRGEAPFGVPLDTIYGFHAVQLFFMISGFVIYWSLERSATWRDFSFSRVTRLYPTYWAAVTLLIVIERVVFGKTLWLGGYLTNMTMFQEFLGFTNLDNVFWSLTVEISFYVIMGLLFATGLLPRIEVVAAIWLALAGLWSVVDQYFGIPLPAALPRLLILPHVPYFVAGITLFLISLRRFTPARLALLLGALAVGGFSDALAGDQGAAMGWGAILQRLVVASLLVAIFALAVTGRLRFSISPVTRWLGGISYSLYLSHRNLGYMTLFRLQDAGVPAWASVLLTFAGALLLATALHYTVERPASRALRGWYRARRGVVAERS